MSSGTGNERIHSSSKKQGMFNGASPVIFELAKGLRKKMTYSETLLWNYLKAGVLGCKFRSQHPISNYIVDFYCHKVKVVIEVDGNIHDSVDVQRSDVERDQDLNSVGYKVIRFRNEEVLNDINTVMTRINTTVDLELQKLNLLTDAKKSSL